MKTLQALITPLNAHTIFHHLISLTTDHRDPHKGRAQWPSDEELQVILVHFFETGDAEQLANEVRRLANLLTPTAQMQLMTFINALSQKLPDATLLPECL